MRTSDYRQGVAIEIYTQENLTDEWWSTIFGHSVKAGTATAIGDGLVGMNLRVPLSSDSKDVPSSVVVKLASNDPTSRFTGITLRNYEREVKFYNNLAATVHIRKPRCFYADWHETDGDFVIVLEDMSPAEQGNQITGCKLGHAEAAIDELVALHAPRWNDPSLWDVDFLQRRASAEDATTLQMIYSGVKSAFLTSFGDAIMATCGESGIDFVHQLEKVLTQYVSEREEPFTVIHGDFRLDNMLFASAHGGAKCVVVDWQTPGHGNGIADLAYFIGAGLVLQDRRAYEQQLVDRYIAGLQSQGVDVDADWVHLLYRREAAAGVLMSVVASQIVQRTDRGDQMFTAMATRHIQHALDSKTLSLI